jgi:nicotinamidase-related amidase
MNPFKLDAKETALVLIDIQKGILGFPLAPHPAAQIVAGARRLAVACGEAGATVVLIRVAYSSADAPSRDADMPMPVPPGGLPPEFSELAPELLSAPHDLIVTKRSWGAFYGTELDLQLRRREIRHILLGGVATNFGVESTAREAWQHNYVVHVVEDATTSIGDGLHRFSIENILPRIAHISSVDEAVGALATAS